MRMLRHIVCIACLACMAWAVEPKDALNVLSATASNRIGGIQRVPVGNIMLRVDWMRRGPTGPSYSVYSMNVQIRQIKPYGTESGECSMPVPPPCREGETEAGFTVTPISAFYILEPRSL